jgi:F-type H+-transporting ATPase subunit gamma
LNAVRRVVIGGHRRSIPVAEGIPVPTLREIKRRIRSVESTEQITRAMKMIAGARLRSAQGRMLAMRPYVRELARVLAGLLPQLSGDEHTLLERRDPARATGLLLISPDRGLCGGLPGNLARRAASFVEEARAKGQEVVAFVSGRKGLRALRRLGGVEVAFEAAGESERPPATLADRIAKSLAEAFESGRIDEASAVYAEFRSAASQRIVCRRLLPVEREALTHDAPRAAREEGASYLAAELEPGLVELAAAAIVRHVGAAVYKALLEGAASELGARLTAMDAATRNAGELIGDLTLEYNKARQAAITKEMLDIAGGVEAMR